jgi:hypothetical protein
MTSQSAIDSMQSALEGLNVIFVAENDDGAGVKLKKDEHD